VQNLDGIFFPPDAFSLLRVLLQTLMLNNSIQYIPVEISISVAQVGNIAALL
jgi:hypothetical protein